MLLGLIAIPGVGPLLLQACSQPLLRAQPPACAGGILGALVDYGISKEEGQGTADSIRRGGSLASVRTDETKADQAELIMQRREPVEIEERGRANGERGWRSLTRTRPSFTDKERQGAPPLSAEPLVTWKLYSSGERKHHGRSTQNLFRRVPGEASEKSVT